MNTAAEQMIVVVHLSKQNKRIRAICEEIGGGVKSDGTEDSHSHYTLCHSYFSIMQKGIIIHPLFILDKRKKSTAVTGWKTSAMVMMFKAIGWEIISLLMYKATGINQQDRQCTIHVT